MTPPTLHAWREFGLHVGMPHLAPGRLSEEAIVKQLGAFQWQAVAALAGQPENALLSEAGERLHISMISIELGMPAGRDWEDFDEGCDLVFRQRTGVFGHKLVEGLFLFDKEPIPDSEVQAVQGRDDLAHGSRPWAYVTHGFITRHAGTWAKLETPRAFLVQPLPELPAMPGGIAEHRNVERSGAIEGFPAWSEAQELPCDSQSSSFDYQVEPETDLNALGAVYCARLPAIMASGERRFLRSRLPVPLSEPLVACLRTEHRRLYYFATASGEEKLRVRVQARFCPPAQAAPARVRTMGRFLFRTDVHRASDDLLMASALVEKALRVPGSLKPLLTESERLLARLQGRA
jgi:probable biosynthetic protein (TIGR04098 family)